MTAFEEKDFNGKKFESAIWKKIFKYMNNLRKELVLLVIAMVLLACVEVCFPLMTKYCIDNYIAKNTLDGFPGFIAVFCGLVLFNSFCVYAFIHLSGKIEVDLTHDIRLAGFKKLQELSFSYYDKTPVGYIMARLTSDVSNLGAFIAWTAIDMVWGVAVIVATIIAMFFLDITLSLITLSVAPFLVIASFYFQKKILKSHRIARRANSRVTGALNEGITASRTTKSIVREQQNLEEFSELTAEFYTASVRASIIATFYFPIMLTLGSTAVGLCIMFGSERLLSGLIEYGTLIAFITYAMQILEPISQIARTFNELQSAQASAERTIALLETEAEIVDSEEVKAVYGGLLNPKKTNWPKINGDIEFRNVSFKYTDNEEVLEDFNLRINAGDRIALVGETGAGKSTIVNLICRFYEPDTGQILIDGVDIRERSLGFLHSNLGYVLQSPHLFSGTVKDNIRYGNLDATDEEIINASKLIGAHDFIEALKDGYDTFVGEGGGKLSTGEKQLISFARAIINNPHIFILDEATSSIDTETENLIKNAIEVALKGRTSFIVAHRLSTIRNADRILVIENGKILEDGSHETLMEQKGHYYQLITNSE